MTRKLNSKEKSCLRTSSSPYRQKQYNVLKYFNMCLSIRMTWPLPKIWSLDDWLILLLHSLDFVVIFTSNHNVNVVYRQKRVFKQKFKTYWTRIWNYVCTSLTILLFKMDEIKCKVNWKCQDVGLDLLDFCIFHPTFFFVLFCQSL